MGAAFGVALGAGIWWPACGSAGFAAGGFAERAGGGRVVAPRVERAGARVEGARRAGSARAGVAASRIIASMCPRCSAGIAVTISCIIRRIAVSAMMRSRITGSDIMRMCNSIICSEFRAALSPAVLRALSGIRCPSCPAATLSARRAAESREGTAGIGILLWSIAGMRAESAGCAPGVAPCCMPACAPPVAWPYLKPVISPVRSSCVMTAP